MSAKPVKITDHLSIYPLLIRMIVAETGHLIATGTGFVYEYDKYLYLITNGHCITGINPETNTRLSKKHAGFPTLLKVNVRYKPDDSVFTDEDRERLRLNSKLAYGTIHPEQPIVDLYTDEECTQPTWYIHPEHGYQVDVVAIPICKVEELPAHILIYPINKLGFTLEPVVADDVFILGYPYGITDPLELPVWKKGSIATEPFIPYKGLPRMLIDTATRTGMSGSPVILRRGGVHNLQGGAFGPNSWIGTETGFAGVYSGRYNALEDEINKGDAQLGIVWRKEVIEEILAAKIKGTTEFQTLCE